MKKMKQFMKNHWISVWLVMAIVILCGGIAFAKFPTPHNTVKRVIATDTGAGSRFTSDYLAVGNSNQHIRNVSPTYTGTIEYDFHVYNYSVNKPTQWYSKDLEYTLTMQIKTLDGTTALTAAEVNQRIGSDHIFLYTVSLDENDQEVTTRLLTVDKDARTASNNSQVITNSARGGSFNSYRLVLPNSMVGKDISVVITATPASKHREIADMVLSARFGASAQTIVLSTGWTGAFSDDTTVSLASYQGFNYSITGSGSGSGTLSWNYGLLELNVNEIFDLFGVDITNNSNYDENPTTRMRTITLSNLSSANNAGRYDFQIYIKDAAAKKTIETLNDWTTFSTYCVFTQN